MNLEIQSLRRAETATLRLRGLYESYGYRKYRMGRFEEYSLYAANKSFLLGENVPTFTDLDGRLMALKPDVTLSIAKNTRQIKIRARRSIIWRVCTVRARKATLTKRSARWDWSAWAAWMTA